MIYSNLAEYEKTIIASFLNSHWFEQEDQNWFKSQRLDPDIFFTPFHKDIVKTINFLLDKNEICDDLAVDYYARKSRFYRDDLWSDIIGRVPMPVKSVQFYIPLLEKAYKSRLLKSIM
jgi:replicative DNA helicase